MGGPGYSPPHDVRFNDPADYKKVLRHAYNFHARMINRGWLSADGAHTVAQTEDTPDEFGYWQSRLTKHDVAKHYASAVFAIHKAHFSYASPWKLSDSEMKQAQADVAGGEQHLPNIMKFAKNFAERLSGQGKNYDSSSIGSQFDSESDPIKDSNSDIYKYIKEEMDREFDPVKEYHNHLRDQYHHHMEMSADPGMFDSDDPQVKMTRTPTGHHYAACAMVIVTAARQPEFWDVPVAEKRKAQVALAGGMDHLRNIKQFAAHFKAKTEDGPNSGLVAGFPKINLDVFHTEGEMNVRQLIQLKLALITESSDFDTWFNNSATAAAAGAERLRREKESTGLTHSADLRYKHPDTPGYGYQSGKKKAGEGLRYWKKEDGVGHQYFFVHQHHPDGSKVLVSHEPNATNAFEHAQQEANYCRKEMKKGFRDKGFFITLGSIRMPQAMSDLDLDNEGRISSSKKLVEMEQRYRDGLHRGELSYDNDGFHSAHLLHWHPEQPMSDRSDEAKIVTSPDEIDQHRKQFRWTNP